jgi:hypothetical protein
MPLAARLWADSHRVLYRTRNYAATVRHGLPQEAAKYTRCDSRSLATGSLTADEIQSGLPRGLRVRLPVPDPNANPRSATANVIVMEDRIGYNTLESSSVLKGVSRWKVPGVCLASPAPLKRRG